MNQLYLVVNEEKIPITAYESYQDARSAVENLFGKSITKQNKHIVRVPFCGDSKHALSADSVDDVVKMTIRATLAAYEVISSKFIQTMESTGDNNA